MATDEEKAMRSEDYRNKESFYRASVVYRPIYNTRRSLEHLYDFGSGEHKFHTPFTEGF